MWFLICRFRFWVTTAIVLLLSSTHFASWAQTANETARSFVIGVQRDIAQRELTFLEDSLNHAVLSAGDLAITIRMLPREDFAQALNRGDVDFIFTDPAVFVSLERHFGMRAVASLLPQESTNAQSVSAAALIAAQSSPVRTLHDASGRPLIVLEGFLQSILKSDLQAQGYDTDKFFSQTQPPVATVEEALNQAVAHPDAVALIPACWLEKNRSARGVSQVHVIEPRRESRFSCERTTSAYPGWTLSRTADIQSADSTALCAMLLSMPLDKSGLAWTNAQNYRSMHHALEAAKDPFYFQVGSPSWDKLLREYYPLVLTTVTVVLVLIIYGYLVSRLAGRRARELLRARREQEDAQHRFEALERVSIVGQMSSVVAHELRQPITAIGNYANSIARRLKRNELTNDSIAWAMQRINAESNRANEIIEHVRNYAKHNTSTRLHINLSQAVAKALSDLSFRVKFEGKFQQKIEPNIFYEADPLEISLVISNLCKNAIEASAHREDALIMVELFQTDDKVELLVSDNGLTLTDEAIAEFCVPLRSNKKNGLGLGLSIVRRIVESYSGDLIFEALRPQGLKVIIKLPLLQGN